MTCDPMAWHNVISEPLERLEVIVRLSPRLPTDREYAETMSMLLDIAADYMRVVRTVVDAGKHRSERSRGMRPSRRTQNIVSELRKACADTTILCDMITYGSDSQAGVALDLLARRLLTLAACLDRARAALGEGRP